MRHHRTFKLAALAIALATLFAADAALAAARIGLSLQRQLASALPFSKLEIVVVFEQSGPVSPTQIQALRALGIQRGISLRALPIVGALATPPAIHQLSLRAGVLSIHANDNLSYFNDDARRLSGVDQLQADGVKRQDELLRCEPGEHIALRREPDNSDDPNAILVLFSAPTRVL